MNQKKIFEIPIYSMSKKEFDKRWNKKRTKRYNELINHRHTDEDAAFYESEESFPRCLWEYNHIIGYIKISVSEHDVWFDIFCSQDNIYYADSKQKHFIRSISEGNHFYVSNYSDEQIKETILKRLKIIENDHLRKNFYVDYSVFNNIIDFINIEQIMKTL